MAPRSPSLLTILPLLFFLFSSSLHVKLLCANAQSYTPEGTAGPVSAFIDGEVMYVHGGIKNMSGMTAQFFSLDLSTSWDVATPAYKQLPDGVENAWNAGTLLNDSTTLFILVEPSYYYYNVKNGQLTGYSVGTNRNATHAGQRAVTNPHTGQICVPFGDNSHLDSAYSLLRLDPVAKKVDSVVLPVSLPYLSRYSAAWSDYLDAMLMFGGIYNSTPISSLFRYNYADLTWTSIPTTGTGPSARHGACFTPVSGGRKMVVFGGDTQGTKASNDIYVLDVTTWQWTRGPDAPDARASAACGASSSSDMFVAWGGYYIHQYLDITPILSTLAVYNLKSNTWVDRFTYTPPSPPTGGSNLGGIIGGIAAGCVVLCGVMYAVHRSRKAKNAKPGHDVDQHGSSFPGDSRPPVHTTTTLTANVQQQPSYTHARPATSMTAAFTSQPPPLLPQSSVAPSPAPTPASNYYQQHAQNTPYQIPIVNPQVADYQQYRDQQEQPYQLQFQYEQSQREQLQRQQELEQYRVKEAELEEERVLARHIEEQMTRLQSLKVRRQASDESPVPSERY